jgi:hypothetical protein
MYGPERVGCHWFDSNPGANLVAQLVERLTFIFCPYSFCIVMSALVVMGELVEPGQIGYCEMGGNHSELVREIREERMRCGFNVNESSALCLRCGKAVPLKSRL